MPTQRLCTSRYRRPFAAALLLLVTVSGSNAQAAPSSQTRKHPEPMKHGRWVQVGTASWYGHRFQNRRTASGEAFDLHMYTCAHRTLPIGTLVKVTNLATHRSVLVRVNDRGPLAPGLAVDLSYAAARALGFNHGGRMRVRLEKVEGAEMAQLNWPAMTNGIPMASR